VSEPATLGRMASRVSEDVWSGRDTTPDAIEAALRGLLRHRHAADRAVAPARVLNLVVVVDRACRDAVAKRLERVGRYDASRTILCTVDDERRTLDATAVMSYSEPGGAGLRLVHEKVEIEIGPEHLSDLHTIVGPVLARELPTALWCAHGHERAFQSLLGKVDAILLDSDELIEPRAGLVSAGELVRSAYVVDLAWLRTTPWRERLAASFDPPDRRAALRTLKAISIRHRPGSAATGLLLAGWLASRLRWEVVPRGSSNGAAPRRTAGTVVPDTGVEIALEPFDQGAPGLAGITMTCRDGFSLSLDRAPGGLRACERSPAGDQNVWQVLGASRGEGGILGEGVRQAQLRDPTYAPAVEAACGLSQALGSRSFTVAAESSNYRLCPGS
jgi:glucose-6-phosphate dehydrogenase assembly protein OpcA